MGFRMRGNEGAVFMIGDDAACRAGVHPIRRHALPSS